ncbi:hypothetical protein RQP46_000722 [Phenoliferia psychrophenolica]
MLAGAPSAALPLLLQALSRSASGVKLPPDANRILFVKNLNYKTRGDDLYDLFGKYGGVRQIRLGNEAKTRGTAYVVFDEIVDAKNAFDHLNGFHLQERYLDVAAAKIKLNIVDE